MLKKIFYIKESLGKGGQPIKVYKVRTMTQDADERFKEVMASCPSDSLGKPLDDPRVTKFGSFLRRSWIDELPQFYNLFKGDIKWVGIRPMREIDWKRFPNSLKKRALKNKPGLFGVQYANAAHGKLEDCFDELNTYLDQYEKHPIKTDITYGLRILKNILLRKVKSR